MRREKGRPPHEMRRKKGVFLMKCEGKKERFFAYNIPFPPVDPAYHAGGDFSPKCASKGRDTSFPSWREALKPVSSIFISIIVLYPICKRKKKINR